MIMINLRVRCLFGWVALILALVLAASCSTTKNLPEDEYLYTGIKSINIEGKQKTEAEKVALEELDAALAYPPNNALFGSSTMRFPLPIGLWIYNSMEDKEYKGLKKWYYNTFATVPKTITSAAPSTRSQVANNLLQNYGYFHSKVDYNLITGKNPRTQKIEYNVKLDKPYRWDSILYVFPPVQDSIVTATAKQSKLKVGNQFSVVDMQNEKTRLNKEFHNNGFYYYRPDYILYFADSTNHDTVTTDAHRGVTLLVVPERNIPQKAMRQWKIGHMSVYVRKNGTTGTTAYDDTVKAKLLTYAYQGKHVPLAPRVMFRGFRFWTGVQYNEEFVSNSISALSSTGLFSNLQFTFTPQDTTDTCSVLDVRLDATMNKLIDGEVEFDFSQKSNSQIGPNAAVTFSKKNAFYHGETLSLKVKGSYYWQYKDRNNAASANNIDSYMWGAEASISFPWVMMPGLQNKFRKYPCSTKFGIGFSRENIARVYRFNTMNLDVDYNFQESPFITHTFSPLSLKLVHILDVDSTLHDDTSYESQRYLMALRSEFIPAIQYKFKYNNSSRTDLPIQTYLELTLKESGNIISGIQAIAGKDFNERNKNFGFKNYSQFAKVTLELRNRYRLTPRSCIATRLFLGGIFAYGNSAEAPISEQFYCGGANSVRAFSTRSIGPGNFHVNSQDYYLYHSGDVKFEANLEYRFPIFGSLYGATFVDAGNVWSLKDDSQDSEFKSKFNIRNFLDQLALGSGFGLRYDLNFLVLRLDVGVAIHAPYQTSRSGYYNIPHWWKDGVQIHFAVGYPF